MIRAQGRGASFISREEFGQWLKRVSNDWQEKSVASPSELTPTITIYINHGVDHQVRFYESEPELAMIVYDGHYQYYSIPKEDYQEIYSLWAIRSYGLPEAVVQAIADGKRTMKQSIQDIPVGVDYKVLKFGKIGYYIYEENGRYYCELPYQFINELSEGVYKGALEFAETPNQEKNSEKFSEVGSLVEDRLTVIMSSPQQSSNPEDYVKANQQAYEEILKLGGEEALAYMLAQFEQGKAEGLRGQLMMRLCKAILGVRNTVSDEGLSPQEWFSWLSVRQKRDLPDLGRFLMTNNKAKDIEDSQAWASNLSVNDVQSIEMVISPSDREKHYKKFSSVEFGAIIKIINASQGQKVNVPEELGSTITLYITTIEGLVHSYQNLRNAYLVIDNVYFSADNSWLESSFENFKGDASLPDGFFERVTGITTTYGLMKLGRNGKVLSLLYPLEGKYRQLAEETVFNYFIKSTLYPPQDIDSFDVCYMLRVIYSSNNSNTVHEEHDYYLFTLNSDTYMQTGKDGSKARVDIELYNRIDTLLNSSHSI